MKPRIKRVVESALHPKHLAFWGLLAAIASVISLIIALTQGGPDTSRQARDTTPQSVIPTASSSARTGYAIAVNSAPAILAFAPGSPFEWIFPKGKLATLKVPDWDAANCPPINDWVHANGGVDLNRTVTQFVVTAGSAQVVVDSAEVDVLERTKVRADEWENSGIHCGGGGPLSVTYLQIELNTGNAIMSVSNGPQADAGSSLVPFGLALKPYEADRVMVQARPAVSGGGGNFDPESMTIYKWRLKLSVLVNGERSYAYIDDNGKPFMTAI